MGLVQGVRATEDLLAASGEGAVLTISSTAALEHFGPGPTSYSALKAAATVYAAGLAQTLAAKGIRVNTIAPGPIFFEDGPLRIKLSKECLSLCQTRSKTNQADVWAQQKR